VSAIRDNVIALVTARLSTINAHELIDLARRQVVATAEDQAAGNLVIETDIYRQHLEVLADLVAAVVKALADGYGFITRPVEVGTVTTREAMLIDPLGLWQGIALVAAVIGLDETDR
jgi:hypothetical protein